MMEQTDFKRFAQIVTRITNALRYQVAGCMLSLARLLHSMRLISLEVDQFCLEALIVLCVVIREGFGLLCVCLFVQDKLTNLGCD